MLRVNSAQDCAGYGLQGFKRDSTDTGQALPTGARPFGWMGAEGTAALFGSPVRHRRQAPAFERQPDHRGLRSGRLAALHPAGTRCARASCSWYFLVVKLDLPKEREFDGGTWYSTSASTWYPTHYHDELEFKLVLWGSAVYEMGSCRTVLGPGSALWLAPGQVHTLVEVSDDLAMWVSSFREDAVHLAERQSGVRVLDQASGWGAWILPSAWAYELSTLCSRLVLRQAPEEYNALLYRLLVRALDAWQGRGAAERPLPSKPARLHPSVARAVALLRTPEADMTLEQLARRCSLSGPRLSRLFKQQMGLSVVQYRNHHRVQRFITEFGRGDRETMLEVALRVGFGSYPQFHRAFCQVTGYAPSEHVRRVRAGVVVPTGQGRQVRLGTGPDKK